MFKETLTDTDVENLIVHMQPHDFKAWVTSPDRTDADFANLVKLARALGKAGVLEDDSPLSQFSINTFWQDLATTFPRMIGYVMLLPTIEERKRVRDSLQGLEVSTVLVHLSHIIPHRINRLTPHYPTPHGATLFEVYFNERQLQKSVVLAHGIREGGRAPILHFLLNDAEPEEIEVPLWYLLRHFSVCIA